MWWPLWIDCYLWLVGWLHGGYYSLNNGFVCWLVCWLFRCLCIGWLVDLEVDWLVGWLDGLLVGWFVKKQDWLVARFVRWLICCLYFWWVCCLIWWFLSCWSIFVDWLAGWLEGMISTRISFGHAVRWMHLGEDMKSCISVAPADQKEEIAREPARQAGFFIQQFAATSDVQPKHIKIPSYGTPQLSVLFSACHTRIYQRLYEYILTSPLLVSLSW